MATDGIRGKGEGDMTRKTSELIENGMRRLLKRMHLYQVVRNLLYVLGFRHSQKMIAIPLDRLLCGGENGLSAAQYARHTGNLLRPSTLFSRSPYVQFLEQYLRMGDDIFRPEVFRKTAYFANAVECINAAGSYYSCTREDELEQIAKYFIRQFEHRQRQGDTATPGPHFLPLGSPLRLRRVQYSDYYEVVEDAHNAAVALVRGEKTYASYLTSDAATTPLQQLLLDHAFTCDGRPRLYQPVESPEVEKWQLIRRCSDRFELIRRFLHDQNLMPPGCDGYLDIACNYGWFVKAFGELGFRARGVEMDWAAVELGKLVYGLRPDQITRSEAVRFLKDHPQRYDVTSCFSLLHHFLLGRASVSGEEMLRLIDRMTGTVLFLDMGQCHEEWFRESLAGWDADRIEQWILDNSSFTKVYRLGKDCDSVEPYQNNYGRTLFACTRSI